MRILLTGATGYIGQHLLIKLLHEGHEVICCVRNPDHFRIPKGFEEQVTVRKVDFLNLEEAEPLNIQVEVAYYLIHSMSASIQSFDDLELRAARNFLTYMEGADPRQVIYLSGISNEETLSRHLSSRFQVEQELRKGSVPVTVLRAGIIVGAGSASFEIIRDLVEKLPFMIAPKWLLTRCQPIYIGNVLAFLAGVANKEKYFGQVYDIGGPDILTYKSMLETFAQVRGLKRTLWTAPVMTPRLSSYWLFFVTSVSYPLAVNLVNSMKVEVVCEPNTLEKELGIELIPYQESVERALKLYSTGEVVSSWKDALSSSYRGKGLSLHQQVPRYGSFKDEREIEITGKREQVLRNVWAIGGNRGWYYGNWL